MDQGNNMGPHWDSAEQALYFVSIFDKSVHKYDPATGATTSSKMGKKNHFVVGLGRKVLEVTWDGAQDTAAVLRTVTEVDHENPNNRRTPGEGCLLKGSLYRISAEGAATRLADNIDISNGLCWDLKERAFYYADSFEYTIRRYDYDVDTGDISNPRTVFKYADHKLTGIVDGMTIDTDGNLWVANFDGNQVLKIDPRTSKLLQKVPIPARQVTSATFGGPGLDVLYVTSASMNRGEEQKPPCGSTFKITGLGVKGHENVNVKLN
ncbi:Regucalcin [Operophtera brumata]|uniref:Regucalcin n=1 Tax=Operophtera brumata TaxID=104452 RepID=A0A0L7L6D7_OPEBR|nr:Regucalcin [Operophtera brumata]